MTYADIHKAAEKIRAEAAKMGCDPLMVAAALVLVYAEGYSAGAVRAALRDQ